MTRGRWLILIAVCGLAIFGLSFVNAWIVHDREIRGEGYRHAQHFVSAWRGVGMPVLTVGALAAIATAGWALAVARRPALRAWPLCVGAGVVLGVLLATAVPVGQDSHASSVDLSAGPLLPVGAVLALAMIAGSLVVAGPRRPLVLTVAAIGTAALLGGAGGRWAGLQLGEGEGRHWSDGSYTRGATAGEGTETLTIRDGAFAIADRWGGRWEWSGWTVSLDGDPACPDSRGTYHAHGVGDEDLRFVKVVDTCADGARGADLEAGIWERDP
jgi:hypothetical protein